MPKGLLHTAITSWQHVLRFCHVSCAVLCCADAYQLREDGEVCTADYVCCSNQCYNGVCEYACSSSKTVSSLQPAVRL